MNAIYPDCHIVTRPIRVGGMRKDELLAEVRKPGIEVNEAGRVLFASELFTTAPIAEVIRTIEVSVADLGYPDGAIIANIFQRAGELGLCLCPLEVGPHLRLQYLDQPEGYLGQLPSQNRAPPGSITVASRPLTQDDDMPKGFYLRRIDGALWLRGYRSGPEHVWSPEDHFIFCHTPSAA